MEHYSVMRCGVRGIDCHRPIVDAPSPEHGDELPLVDRLACPNLRSDHFFLSKGRTQNAWLRFHQFPLA